MLTSPGTVAPPASVDVAPPLVPGGGEIAHAEFLGLPFSLLTQGEVIEVISADCGAPYRYVVTPNSYHVVAAHDAPACLLPIYRAAWLSVCDSRIVRALARLDRRTLPLVTGSDLVAALLARLNAQGRPGLPQRILIVGPPRSVAVPLEAAYPNLIFDILPALDGLAHDAERRLGVARACVSRRWDIALLCLGCPAQELIAHKLADLGRQSGIALCVGASIDFLTGARTRAPRWLQRLSLEWAYRLAREPGRLWRRYLIESPKILRIFIAARSQRGQ
jgi:N-acetylglucosaminyldiphosphoundecaprenol N-acetyl-beta-D-mannosaminyltransferase